MFLKYLFVIIAYRYRPGSWKDCQQLTAGWLH